MSITPKVDWAEGMVEAGYHKTPAWLSVDHKGRIYTNTDGEDRGTLLSDGNNGAHVCLAVAALCMRAVAWNREDTPDGPRLAQLAAELETLAQEEQ